MADIKREEWKYEECETMDFGDTPQAVSADFYKAFTANAEQISGAVEEEGTPEDTGGSGGNAGGDSGNTGGGMETPDNEAEEIAAPFIPPYGGNGMIDQLFIEDKGSFDDFGASLALRTIKQPKKKSIKETLPYSNETHDFSAINGEVYWEERELEYQFEMTADTPEELEDMKTAFSCWVMGVTQARIVDPFIFGYHFVGTYEDMDFEDDEGMDKTTATVKFAAYPYKLSNMPKRYRFTIPANKTLEVSVINESAHRIVPTLKTSGETVFKIGARSYAVPAGEITDDTLMFAVGLTEFSIQNPTGTACTVEVSFFEEVF